MNTTNRVKLLRLFSYEFVVSLERVLKFNSCCLQWFIILNALIIHLVLLPEMQFKAMDYSMVWRLCFNVVVWYDDRLDPPVMLLMNGRTYAKLHSWCWKESVIDCWERYLLHYVTQSVIFACFISKSRNLVSKILRATNSAGVSLNWYR